MAKQGDSDAHKAYCQLSGSYAVTERGLLGWEECCREALKNFGGDGRSSPPAESRFEVKKPGAFVLMLNYDYLGTL